MPRMLRRIYRIHVYKKVLPPAVRPFLPRPFETGGHTGTAIVHARGPSVRGATNACDPARITPNGDRPAERFRPASSKSLPRGQRPKGGAEGIRLAESSVNPAGLRLKRHMDKLAPRFRRRSPARSSFRFSARRSDCTLWLCRRLCGVELCGARQDSGPPQAEAAARAALRRCNVATACAGFSKA